MSENKPQVDIPETIEAYRTKFSRGPIGRWTSAFGFAPGPSSVWEFDSNGTGKLYDYSGSGDRISWFNWLPVTERTIQYQLTKEVEQLDSGDFDLVDEPPQEWITIVYDFKLINFYGPKVVMFQVPEQETFKFGWTLDYLRYTGDIT